MIHAPTLFNYFKIGRNDNPSCLRRFLSPYVHQRELPPVLGSSECGCWLTERIITAVMVTSEIKVNRNIISKTSCQNGTPRSHATQEEANTCFAERDENPIDGDRVLGNAARAALLAISCLVL